MTLLELDQKTVGVVNVRLFFHPETHSLVLTRWSEAENISMLVLEGTDSFLHPFTCQGERLEDHDLATLGVRCDLDQLARQSDS